MGYGKRMKREASNDNAAVILGLCPTGLAVARALGRSGVKVYGIDKERMAVGFFSRYCRRLGYFDIDNPSRERDLLVSLLEFGKTKTEKPVIFATSDDFLVFLAKYDKLLKQYFFYPDLDEEILDNFLNKEKFYKICSKIGIAIPKTVFLNGAQDLSSIAKRASYPCIFKPIYTHIWDRKLKGIKAFLVNSPSELIEKYNMIKDIGLSGNIMIQEVIEGSSDEIYIFAAYFDKNSGPTGIFTGKKIRQYPPDFGTTTSAVSLHNAEVSSASIKILKHLKHKGLCDVEFKRDPRDGKFKMMEINPRVGRWYGLVEASGINQVYSAYADLTGGRAVHQQVEMEEGRKWIFWERDIFTVLSYIMKKALNLKGYFNSIKGKKVSAIYSKDDILPAIVFPFNQLSLLLRKRAVSKG